MNSDKKILVLGGSGLVGSQFINYLHDLNIKFLAPSHKQLNVLDVDALTKYIKKKGPKILINFIAHTNLEEAEKERNNKTGLVWQINSKLPAELAKICRIDDIFLIHISTDAVFPGSQEFKGPYSEDQKPGISEELSWYGETKKQAEIAIKDTLIKFAIIRINYPFGNIRSKKDFAIKTYKYIISGKPLFTDQLFNPTYLADLNITLSKLIQTEIPGIFHVASKGLSTPFSFGKLIARLKKIDIDIKQGLAKDFIGTLGKPIRSIYGGLNTTLTEQRLGLKFHTLEKALEEFCQNNF